MNILFISPHGKLGGALTANINMAKSLVKCGHRVRFFNEYIDVVQGLENDTFPIHRNGFLFQFRSYRYLKSFNPDIIIIGVPGLALKLFFSLLLFRLRSVRIAQVYHSLSLGSTLRDNLIDHVQSLTSFVCTHLIFVSHFTTKSWSRFMTIKLLSKRHYVVYNAIDKCLINNSRGDNVVTIGFVGRFSPEKQPDLFSEVAKKMYGSGIKFEAWGDGALLRSCSEKYSQYVEFHGACFIQNEIYKNIDILLLTSKFENCPMVILEAANRGIPCIAPKVGGIPEVVYHGQNGLLYDNFTVDDIVHCIEEMIPNYKHYSDSSYLRAEAFSLENQSKVFGEIFS